VNQKTHHWILKKRVDLIYANSYAANLTTIVISFLLVLVLKDRFPQSLVWSWFIVITLIASVRIFLARQYFANDESLTIEQWANRYVISSVLIGIVWGCASYFYYYSDEPEVKALLFMLLIGIIASAMIVLSALKESFYGHILPIFLCLSIAILKTESHVSPFLFGGLMLYLALISAAGEKTRQYLIDCLNLQYENQELVLNLQNEIDHHKQTQKDLEIHQEQLEVLVEKRTGQLYATNEALVEEINIRKKAEEKLKHIAYHDELTKLPNRLLLIDRLEHALSIAQRRKTIVAVMFIDLNGFKKINDQYGHAAGDQILKDVAKRLKTSLREEDTISRYGGDEFVILIEHEAEAGNTEILSQKIINALSQPFDYDNHKLTIGCSIGISLYPHDGTTPEDLLEKADAAMYQAKNSGHGQNRMFYS